MQKICAIILFFALASNYEALPQTKWSRPVRNPQGQLTRERRQFPFGDWIPLSHPCPTCRPFADPLDVGLRGENIGLTPPRPPVTRQIHGEGNFFPQDESAILSVPPPPPSAIPRHPINNNANFQFSGFGQQFNNPLPVPQQQVQFLPQPFIQNQQLLVNGNQQILPGINAQNNLFSQDQSQQINNGKIAGFNSEFKTQKIPENVMLEQNNRQVGPKQAFSNKAQPFAQQQQQSQQSFVQQHSFGGQQQVFGNQQQAFGAQQQAIGGQQQIFGNQQQAFGAQQQAIGGQQQVFGGQQFGNSILTPPPAPKNLTQDVVIPGLDKEEIQLLYVPVETLRQKGTPQEQLLTQQPQNVQFFNRGNDFKRPVNNIQPTEQTLTQPKGHFVTQNGNGQGQPDSSIKVTSSQPFPAPVTPSTVFLQHFSQTPQPFVSATPVTPTVDPFVTPASVFQKFSPFTPETTLSHLSTVPNTIQFSQSDEFGTTPKTLTTQGDIINGKSQFSGLKNTGLTHEQGRPFQHQFGNQQPTVTQQPQLTTVFNQEQKEVLTPTHFPHHIDQQQIALQKQQEQQRLLQQQRQKELEEQRHREQQRKQKELEEQRLLQQRQQQHQKELEEQRVLQQKRQKELEHQRFLQKQKELEEQRLLQQRQKELEEQRFLQKQKELEEQRLLQERQKELEEQRFLQHQQRLKELEEQRFLQEQRQKELENQRRLQLQRQKEQEEKRRLQLKQKEEEQRLRVQQQQKELEQQKLLKQQQELQRQKEENYKKFQLFKQQYHAQQQQQQQQLQSIPQQAFQQTNRHVLPANDQLNFIPQLEKESEDQQLVPHQPPLSVFFKGNSGADARITDVLRELRSSNTITVLDQYFEKMPKVFVGPAGLVPPAGYEKFELPYLSNIESNRIERRIGKLPFFVAPLNFVPPPGYAKIPFPAPHVGSVVVSSESNPAMTLKSIEKGSAEVENVSGGFPVVGPELPGLINNLDTVTTTSKPVTYVSTPSLPQTTAQLRNRRPNNSLYKPQTRKPITRTRTTTVKPEEEVTQPIQKVETTESIVRKPFNRFLNRRRQQAKTTTEAPLKGQEDGKNLENRHYSVEVYHKEKNQIPRTQQKSDVIQPQNGGEQFNQQFEQHGSIDRITPSGHGVFEVRPTPDYSKTTQTIVSDGSHPDYADISFQTFEDGPFPTGSAKTITQELYRPNAVDKSQEELNSKTLGKPDSTPSSVKYPHSGSGDGSTAKFSEVSPTAGLGVYRDTVSEGKVSVEPTSIVGYEKQEGSSESYDSTEANRGKVSFTPVPTASGEEHTKSFLSSNEQYTSAFAEISKPHHIPGFVDSSSQQQKFSNVYPTPQISVDLQAPHEQQSQEFDASGEVKPTQNSAGIANKFPPTASSNEQYLTGFDGTGNNQHFSTSQVSSTVSSGEQYATGFSVQNSGEINRQRDDERIGSFINVQDVHSTAESPVSPQQYSTAFPSQATATGSNRNNQYPIYVGQRHPQVSSTVQPFAEVTVNPSVQTYTTAPEGLLHVNEETETSEGHGQDVANNLPNDHRLKLPNPSIVRVRTRVRGKSRGQVNFAASQTTTPVPFTRSGGENRQNENAEHEATTKVNSFREYNPIKTSKYNQYRGVKKPIRTTTEAPAENEQKTVNVYTIRPPRRPYNPSTVSTKRIRRPTTPIPSAESATEAFGISTVGSQSQSEHVDISPSGVSNDVYFEQSSLSPVKHKFRKHFGSADQKNDVGPVYVPTVFPTTAPTYSTYAHEEYTEESNIVKEATPTDATLEHSEKYPEWNPSESGFDVSGIVLTTARIPGQEEEPELEEPKKSQDSKKAFDPDLEKKTGRRRIRVRVHKRPHENFETAESQNLRTVANVLVPPTTTYKPNDESSFQQLAKNADFSFGGQKLFGSRSREYFRKRLNLTSTEGEQPTGQGASGESGEKTTDSKTFVKKAEKTQKNGFESASNQSSESGEGSKITRPKFRGFVRKIVKHGGANKEADSDANQVPENEETGDKHETTEYHPRQTFRGGFNHTGRVNGTRHKTFVRYVKKNKIRQHETETVHEARGQEPVKEEQGLHQTTEIHTPVPVSQETNSESQTTETEDVKEERGKEETQENPVRTTQQQPDTTEEAETKETEQPFPQTTQATESEVQESSSQETSTTLEPVTPPTHLTGVYLTQRPKFYQTLRPVFQRPTLGGFQRNRETESTPTGFQRHGETETTSSGFQRHRETESTSSGFHRNRETDSTHTGFHRNKETDSAHTGFHRNKETDSTIHEPQERRTGYSRYKYGKPTGFGSTSTEKSDDTKKVNEQLKNKNLHTLEVRKYLRAKNREGAFSQFSKNKYSTSEKVETTTDEESIERESEEITTERAVKTSPSEPKTTEVFAASTEIENEEETETRASTIETATSSEEESSEDDNTSAFKVETTTETEVPTTIFHTTSTETPEKATEPRIQTTETVEPQRTEYEPDIYRFSKHSFSFDEAEKFTGTKNRAHVRNITTAILENTASFSAPGVEKRPEINVITQTEELTTEIESHSDVTEKTEAGTTESSRQDTTTTEYPETETAPSADAVTKAKIAKVLKTSTTTKISHETEICYRGKCIRTKSENPDEDLKLLVDSASTMKIEKTKT